MSEAKGHARRAKGRRKCTGMENNPEKSYREKGFCRTNENHVIERQKYGLAKNPKCETDEQRSFRSRERAWGNVGEQRQALKRRGKKCQSRQANCERETSSDGNPKRKRSEI